MSFFYIFILVISVILEFGSVLLESGSVFLESGPAFLESEPASLESESALLELEFDTKSKDLLVNAMDGGGSSNVGTSGNGSASGTGSGSDTGPVRDSKWDDWQVDESFQGPNSPGRILTLEPPVVSNEPWKGSDPSNFGKR